MSKRIPGRFTAEVKDMGPPDGAWVYLNFEEQPLGLGPREMATMYDPPHLGELIRESIEAKGWTVVENGEAVGHGPGDAVASAKRPRRGFGGDGA